MMLKTHLAVAVFFALLFLPFIEYKTAFIFMVLIATYFPDVDSPNSKIGSRWYFRPLQWIASHRGFFHSLIFLILMTALFVLFFPIVAAGFFLGYFLHIFSDSFTVEGIRFFYPFGKTSSWRIRTGGSVEMLIFLGFAIADVVLAVVLFSIV